MISGSLRTGVRIHIIARNDVNSHVRPRVSLGLSSSSYCGNGRFTATVVEQIEICVSEMAICDAINDVVEARL